MITQRIWFVNTKRCRFLRNVRVVRLIFGDLEKKRLAFCERIEKSLKGGKFFS